MTYICVECVATFADLESARQHPYRRLSKDSSVFVPMKRHIIFEATGRGWRTGGSTEPAGQTAVPFRECGTPPTAGVQEAS